MTSRMEGPGPHDRVHELRLIANDSRAAADGQLDDVRAALSRVEALERLMSETAADRPPSPAGPDLPAGSGGPDLPADPGPKRPGRARLRDSGLAELFGATAGSSKPTSSGKDA